jgi:hypothetical protein
MNWLCSNIELNTEIFILMRSLHCLQNAKLTVLPKILFLNQISYHLPSIPISLEITNDLRFEVLTAAFWIVTACGILDTNVSEEYTASIFRA